MDAALLANILTPKTPESKSEVSQLQSLRDLFSTIETIRSSFGLDLEEALLYLCVGFLNTERIQQVGSQGYITSTNISSVAFFMNIPKETARRKVKRLMALDLIEGERGIVVKDITRWFGYVDQMGGRPGMSSAGVSSAGISSATMASSGARSRNDHARASEDGSTTGNNAWKTGANSSSSSGFHSSGRTVTLPEPTA
jgi:hypothetical protein